MYRKMNFQQAKFITSAPSLEQCPPSSLPEVCFAGRSNVGKSTLINAITKKRKLARTSNTPGKTQQMNYYEINNQIYFVDLPGFGYAKVSKKERERWGRDIREYLINREPLHLILHLVDIRHNPTKLDEDFFYWLAENRLPFGVILTKADKLSKNKQEKATVRLKKILDSMNMEVPIILSSAEKDIGINKIHTLVQSFTAA